MLRILICLMLLAAPLRAEMTPALGDKVLKRLIEAPDRFEEEAAGIILGYGTAKGLDEQGIEAYLAVGRARIRVREMRRLLLADLDDDGSVTQAELAILVAAENARGRGRLWLAHGAADGNGDGVVSMTELRARAAMVAAKEQGIAEAEAARDLMKLDLDGNGRVTVAELHRAMKLLVPEV